MTIIADGIDLGAGDTDRAGHLKRIVENVIGDTDPNKTDQERAWIVWSIIYICWYESERATTRVQRRGQLRDPRPSRRRRRTRRGNLGPLKRSRSPSGAASDSEERPLHRRPGAGRDPWPRAEQRRTLRPAVDGPDRLAALIHSSQ